MLPIRLAPPGQVGTGDGPLERLVRSIHEALRQVIAEARRDVIIPGVELPDAIPVTVPHGLGQGYAHVSVSPPRGVALLASTGRIQLLPSTNAGRSLVLRADGWGATVFVDLRVT